VKQAVNISTHYLDLITHLVQRNFILRYKGSSIGVLWSLMLPLCQLLVLVFVFRKVVPLSIEDYPVFVFTALLPWIWFSTCLGSAGGLFTGNRDLIRKPNLSPSTLVIVDTLSNLLPYLLFMPVLFVMLFLYNRPVTPALFYLPVLIVIQGILTAGLGLTIATLNVFYRDVQHIVSVSLMLLFYITPVFYRSQAITESYRIVFKLNPIAGLIDSYRAILFYGRAPELSALLLIGIASSTFCVIGYFIYKHRLNEIIDVV
jgi:lipopolysaccharide transport system permease protein